MHLTSFKPRDASYTTITCTRILTTSWIQEITPSKNCTWLYMISPTSNNTLIIMRHLDCSPRTTKSRKACSILVITIIRTWFLVLRSWKPARPKRYQDWFARKSLKSLTVLPPPAGRLAIIQPFTLPRAALANLQPKDAPPKEIKEQFPTGPPIISLEEQEQLRREHQTRVANKNPESHKCRICKCKVIRAWCPVNQETCWCIGDRSHDHLKIAKLQDYSCQQGCYLCPWEKLLLVRSIIYYT